MAEVLVRAREAFYIRKNELPRECVADLKAKYTFRFYEEKACKQCEWLAERHCDICDNCAAFKGGAELSTTVDLGKHKYVQTPLGDPAGLLETLSKHGLSYRIKRYHPKLEFSRPIKFTGTLKDFQVGATEAILKGKRGVLKSPPRTGKTVMGAYVACKNSKKTLILASQRDWLVGFQETFLGSKTQKPLTNAKKSQVGFCKTLEDFHSYDVCLATVQTFYSEKGMRLLRQVRDLFNMIIVDEVHTSAANRYAQTIRRLNAEFKIGLSGTPSRKDMKFILAEKLIGPILHAPKVERLRPTIKLTRTDYTKTYKGNQMWVRMVGSLEKDPARLKLIAKTAIADVADGHMVLIPLQGIVAIKALTKAINKLADKELAVEFYGAVKKARRDEIIQQARNYKIKIIVGNTKLLSTGINIPRASCLYDCTLSSNKENSIQRVSRILTPWEDKPQPVLRFFLDNMNVRKRCLANEWWSAIKPEFRPHISEKDDIAFKAYFKSRNEGRIEL